MLDGHEFSPQDIHPGSGKVIVNQAMAPHYWPGRNPIGRTSKTKNMRWRLLASSKQENTAL